MAGGGRRVYICHCEGWPGHLAGPPPGRHPGGGGGEREPDGVFPAERRQEPRAIHGGISGQEKAGSSEENQSRQNEGVVTTTATRGWGLHLHPHQTGTPTSPPLPWIQPAQHKLALPQPKFLQHAHATELPMILLLIVSPRIEILDEMVL